MKFKCSNCNKKTSHRFVENVNIIRVVNRSGKRRFGLFKQHYGCILRENEYYLYSCSIYTCKDCGKPKKCFGFPKKITRAKAETLENSGLLILHNLSFWHFIYH